MPPFLSTCFSSRPPTNISNLDSFLDSITPIVPTQRPHEFEFYCTKAAACSILRILLLFGSRLLFPILHAIGDVDMNIQRQSVQSLLQRVENEASRTNPLSPSIFMVPSMLRDVSPDSFNPWLVSIGPLHKEDVNVQAFEVQKVSYLNNLILRIKEYPQEQILESCMEKAYTSMNDIKACYVWTKTYTDPEIAEMMVLDACFILEFMFEFHIYISNESYQGNELQFRTVWHDLVLLENQIRLFFLEEIFRCTILKFKPNFSLIELISTVLYDHNLFEEDLNIDNASISTAHHILSLLHQCYKPPYDIKNKFTIRKIHSAIDLDMAGVNFKPSKDPTWVMGMEVKQYSFPYFFRYWSKTTLTMPVLKIHDSTEFLLRNLIAYEESFLTTSYVTSFFIVMDMLINTQEDVAKLVESKVLVNIMSSNKEAANMINSICKNVTDGSFYGEEWEKLNKYCNFYWPKQIARMRRKYFSSPWSIIALLAGIILFVLQVVQTIFTIKSSGSRK